MGEVDLNMSFDPATQTLLNLIKEVGFPIAVAAYLFWERNKAMAKLTEAIEKINITIEKCKK